MQAPRHSSKPGSDQDVVNEPNEIEILLHGFEVEVFTNKTRFEKRECLLRLLQVSETDVSSLLFAGCVKTLCKLLGAFGKRLEPTLLSCISQFLIRCSKCTKSIARAKMLESPDFVFEVGSYLQDACNRLSKFGLEEADDRRAEEWCNLIVEWETLVLFLCQSPLTLERLLENDTESLLGAIMFAFQVVTERYLNKRLDQCELLSKLVSTVAGNPATIAHILVCNDGEMINTLCNMFSYSKVLSTSRNITDFFAAVMESEYKLQFCERFAHQLATSIIWHCCAFLIPGLWVYQKAPSNPAVQYDSIVLPDHQNDEEVNEWQHCFITCVNLFASVTMSGDERTNGAIWENEKQVTMQNATPATQVPEGFPCGLNAMWEAIPLLASSSEESLISMARQVLLMYSLCTVYGHASQSIRNSLPWVLQNHHAGTYFRHVHSVLVSTRQVALEDCEERKKNRKSEARSTHVGDSLVNGSKLSARETISAAVLQQESTMLLVQRTVTESVRLLSSQLELGSGGAHLQGKQREMASAGDSHETSTVPPAPSGPMEGEDGNLFPTVEVSVPDDLAASIVETLVELISLSSRMLDDVTKEVIDFVVKLSYKHSTLGSAYLTTTLCTLMNQQGPNQNKYLLYYAARSLRTTAMSDSAVLLSLMSAANDFPSLLETSFHSIVQADTGGKQGSIGAREYVNIKWALEMLSLLNLCFSTADVQASHEMWQSTALSRYFVFLRGLHNAEIKLIPMHKNFVPSPQQTLERLEWIYHHQKMAAGSTTGEPIESTVVRKDKTPVEVYELLSLLHSPQAAQPSFVAGEVALNEGSETLLAIVLGCRESLLDALTSISRLSTESLSEFKLAVNRDLEDNGSHFTRAFPGVLFNIIMDHIQFGKATPSAVRSHAICTQLLIWCWEADPRRTLRALVYVDPDDSIVPPMWLPFLWGGDLALALEPSESKAEWPRGPLKEFLHNTSLILFHVLGDSQSQGSFSEHHVHRLSSAIVTLVNHAKTLAGEMISSFSCKLLVLLWRLTQVKGEDVVPHFEDEQYNVLIGLLNPLTRQILLGDAKEGGQADKPIPNKVPESKTNATAVFPTARTTVQAFMAVVELLKDLLMHLIDSTHDFDKGTELARSVISYLSKSVPNIIQVLCEQIQVNRNLIPAVSTVISLLSTTCAKAKIPEATRLRLLPSVALLLRTCTQRESYTASMDHVGDQVAGVQNSPTSTGFGPIPFQLTELASCLPRLQSSELERSRLLVYRSALPPGSVSQQTCETVRMTHLNRLDRAASVQKLAVASASSSRALKLDEWVSRGSKYAIQSMQYKVDTVRQRTFLRQKTNVWRLSIQAESDPQYRRKALLGNMGDGLGPGSKALTLKPQRPEEDLACQAEAEFQLLRLHARWKQPEPHLQRFARTVEEQVLCRRKAWRSAHETFHQRSSEASKQESYLKRGEKWLEEEFGVKLASTYSGKPYEVIMNTRGVLDDKGKQSYLGQLAQRSLETGANLCKQL